jgi:hypothetical protein
MLMWILIVLGKSLGKITTFKPKRVSVIMSSRSISHSSIRQM